MKTILLILAGIVITASGLAQTALDKKPRSAGRLVSDGPAPARRTGGNPTADVFYMGQHYKSARVGAAKDGVAPIFAGGKSVTVPLSALPPVLKARALALQAEGDSSKARWEKVHASQAARTEALMAAARGQALTTKAQISQVLPEGLLIRLSSSQVILLRNYPGSEKLVDGDSVSFSALPDGVFRYTDTLGAVATVRAYKAVTE